MSADEVKTIVFVIFAGAFVVWFLFMPYFVRAEKRRQRKKAQSGTIGVFDEVFHPESHQARLIWEAQTELPAPAPTPGDKPDLESGRIVINISRQNEGAVEDPARPASQCSGTCRTARQRTPTLFAARSTRRKNISGRGPVSAAWLHAVSGPGRVAVWRYRATSP